MEEVLVINALSLSLSQKLKLFDSYCLITN